MRTLLVLVALATALVATEAAAQTCNGRFPPGTVCGNDGPTEAQPGPVPLSFDVNVTDYGAMAGTCSDTAKITANNTAIQTALNTGRNVNFPIGNYPHKSQGFNITTAGQKVHGPTCTGTGTSAPACPASIQDCSLPSDWPSTCAGTPADTCGYLSVYASDVEIHDLWINGNNPFGSGTGTVFHKGIFVRGNPILSTVNNTYIHDTYVTNSNAESIYADAFGSGTRIVRNTVAHGQYSGLNLNNFTMTDVHVTDNFVTDQLACVLSASAEAYVLRNTCVGGPTPSGGDAISVVASSFYVVAYNTINAWNATSTATSMLHLGFFPMGNDTGPGIVAFNTIINGLNTGVANIGAALDIDDVTGPAIIEFNTVINNGNPGSSPPTVLFHGDRTDAILFRNNVLDGNASVSPIGIEIYSNVPMGNRIQIDNTNTFGGIPTQTDYLVAPGGAMMSVFTPTITKAIPYLPALLPGQITADVSLFAPSYLASVGTTPIGTTGSCNTSVTVVGGTLGALNGTWTSTAICGAGGTIILSGLPAAPAGWNCPIVDQTTSTTRIRQTNSNTTSVTYTVDVATAANDILRFGPCAGY